MKITVSLLCLALPSLALVIFTGLLRVKIIIIQLTVVRISTASSGNQSAPANGCPLMYTDNVPFSQTTCMHVFVNAGNVYCVYICASVLVMYYY